MLLDKRVGNIGATQELEGPAGIRWKPIVLEKKGQSSDFRWGGEMEKKERPHEGKCPAP